MAKWLFGKVDEEMTLVYWPVFFWCDWGNLWQSWVSWYETQETLVAQKPGTTLWHGLPVSLNVGSAKDIHQWRH